MNIFKKITFIFNKNQKIQLFILFIAIMIGAVFELLGVTAVLPFINALTNPIGFMNSWYTRAASDLLGVYSETGLIIIFAFVIMIVYIVKNIYLIFLGDMQFRFISGNQRRLSTKILDVYMKQPYLFHVENSSIDLHRNVTGDTQIFFRTVLSALQMMTDICICITLFIFLFLTDKTITIVLTLLMAGYIMFYIVKFRKTISDLGEKNRKYTAIITRLVLQAFGGIKETKIMNKESFFVRYYDKNYKEYIDAQRKNNMLTLIPKSLLETLCISGLLVAISVKLMIGTNLQYFIPTISTFAVAAFRMLPSFNKISGNIGILIFGVPSIDAIYSDLIRVDNLTKDNEIDRLSLGGAFDFQKEIEIKNLYFQYPNTENYVLNNLNFFIQKNESVAFIGPSGAGKTTLADIILGVLEPTKGCVLVDDKDISINMKEWHNKLGYIPQNIYLMDDTLKNNIAYGVATDSIDEDKLWKALEMAQLKEFVLTLEDGIDTMIGEFGTRLSGGQRQRIGIARALYTDPEVLVLDEATSALDSETESAVMDAVSKLAGTKTLIIIAHRLTTIEQCDTVYKIENNLLTKVR